MTHTRTDQFCKQYYRTYEYFPMIPMTAQQQQDDSVFLVRAVTDKLQCWRWSCTNVTERLLSLGPDRRQHCDSPPFQVGPYSWCMRLVRQENHVGIFLMPAEAPRTQRAAKFPAVFRLALISQEDPHKSLYGGYCFFSPKVLALVCLSSPFRLSYVLLA